LSSHLHAPSSDTIERSLGVYSYESVNTHRPENNVSPPSTVFQNGPAVLPECVEDYHAQLTVLSWNSLSDTDVLGLRRLGKANTTALQRSERSKYKQ